MTLGLQDVNGPPQLVIHPLPVRITHWINAIAILIMIGSGWRIWNSSPIFDLKFPIALSLGGEPAASSVLHVWRDMVAALRFRLVRLPPVSFWS
jgi:thiosulfate reductase cytochrome b subunit